MTFKKGETVYDIKGRKCEFVSESADGFVVSPMGIYSEFNGHDDYDVHEHPIGYDLVKKVFKNAPEEVFDVKISEKKLELAKLSQSADALREEVFSIKSEKQRLSGVKDEIIKELKIVKTLHDIKDYLDGKMQYYVDTKPFNIKCGHVSELTCQGETQRSRVKDLKLISLRGVYSHEKSCLSQPKNVEWSLSDYHDGSGSFSGIRLFKTLSEAQGYLKDFCIEKLRTAPDSQKHKFAQELKQNGFQIPDFYKDAYKLEAERQKENSKQSILKDIKYLEGRLDKAKASLNEVL